MKSGVRTARCLWQTREVGDAYRWRIGHASLGRDPDADHEEHDSGHNSEALHRPKNTLVRGLFPSARMRQSTDTLMSGGGASTLPYASNAPCNRYSIAVEADSSSRRIASSKAFDEPSGVEARPPRRCSEPRG